MLTRLLARVRALRLGDGRKDGTDVGPMISEAAVKKAEAYIDIGQAENADLLTGGRRPDGDATRNGWFFEPTIFSRVEAGSRLEQEEIFGPVLSVVRFRTVDEAFAINNDVRYGLSSSVYTRDVNVAMRALSELENGITYINAPTIGAEAHLPFGGVKQTGNGHREGGWEVYDFYSETKVGYLDFSGALQRAQIDTYDL
jgi:aldehyde dehydrogenase (NAD+)